MRTCDQEESEWNRDNQFCWRFSLRGSDVPPDAEEFLESYYEKRNYRKAEAGFRLLTECFDRYAEGYNYLGLIALDEGRLDDAVRLFQQTVEGGRRLFPKRISKKRYWSDLATRPYIRGLRNLTLTLNRVGRFQEALELCDRLERECGG
ncbi:MAG: tetratricopeptide repeat protein [Acidobacteriota bacterium]